MLLPASLYRSELAPVPADRFRIGVGRADPEPALEAFDRFLRVHSRACRRIVTSSPTSSACAARWTSCSATSSAPAAAGVGARGAFTPVVDVYYVADPPRAVVRAELAGVRAAEIELEIRGRELILAGQRRAAEPEEERLYQQLEIQHGPFRRVISLGADVDADAAKATYEDGVLTVELPISAPAGRPHGADPPRGRGRAVIEIATPGAGGEEVAMGAAPPLPGALPVLPLRDTVTFPDTLTPLAVGQERSIRLVNDVLGGDRHARDGRLAATRRSTRPAPTSSTTVGVVGTVARMLKVPDGTLRILVQAGPRVRLEDFTAEQPYLVARVGRGARRARGGAGADRARAQRAADVRAHHRGRPVPARGARGSRSPTSTTRRRSRT